MTLKPYLKRGALITAANWQVVLIQFVADALFKTLLAVPIVGGVFLAVLLVGGDPGELLQEPVTRIIPAMASALLAQPLALLAVLLAVSVVLVGGSLLMFAVKGGTVSVLVSGEQTAGAIERPPLRLSAFKRARQFSLERFTAGAARLFPRYLALGVWLMAIYLVSTLASLAFILAPDPDGGDWRMAAAEASIALVVWITLVNLIYLLVQIVLAQDDCSLREACVAVGRLLRLRFRLIALIFGATLALVILTMAASILAAAALGLIAVVPLVGLAALPLQVIAWLVRGVVFQYIGLTALSAYLHVYRQLRDGVESPADRPPSEVHHIGRTA